jgi:voltage-gated potassium channel
MNKQRRGEAFERFADAVDGPMLVLALLMVPVLLLPLVVDLSPAQDQVLEAVGWMIWAAFAAEYAIKLYLAPDRWRFVRRNIPDLLIVVLPFLRPLRLVRSVRLVRLLRAARLLAFVVEGLEEVRSIMRRRGLNYVLLIMLALLVVAAALVFQFERDQPAATIHSFPDALWWAVTTITTVGYGDKFPTSAAGRGVAVVLMIAGIALFGVITASIAAYFVEKDSGAADTASQLASVASPKLVFAR